MLQSYESKLGYGPARNECVTILWGRIVVEGKQYHVFAQFSAGVQPQHLQEFHVYDAEGLEVDSLIAQARELVCAGEVRWELPLGAG